MVCGYFFLLVRFDCDNALAAADLGSFPVDAEESVSDALEATGLLVTLLSGFLAMRI